MRTWTEGVVETVEKDNMAIELKCIKEGVNVEDEEERWICSF